MLENEQIPEDASSNFTTSSEICPDMALWSAELRATRCLAETLTRADVLTAPAARRRLAARKLEMTAVSAANDHPSYQQSLVTSAENLTDYVPPRQLLMYLIR